MSRKPKASIERRYLDIVSDAQYVADLAPRTPPRIVTVSDARGIVDDILDGIEPGNESDTHFAREELACIIARGLSGEAAYLDHLRRQTSGFARVSEETRDAVLREDAALKRDGVSRKIDRAMRIAERLPVSADWVMKNTPQQGRGRPRKA